jgi:glycine betaine/proline transport system permease protein
MLLLWLFPQAAGFPERLEWGLAAPLDNFQSWVISNRMSHWLFTWFFNPVSDALDALLVGIESLLLATPWTVIVVVMAAIAYRSNGLGTAIFTVIAHIIIGVFGLWDDTIETMALMGVSVFIALAFGIPLGILAARSPRFDSILRPFLDAMQVMPAFVYLIPVVLFFGIARVPAVVATVIYALPPAVRLTALGIRQVNVAAVEAADAFGSTSWQKLRKVQLPLAMPTILLGVNQTIMMALGIVVIAAMIGAGGLGEVVLKGLQRQNVGMALQAGIAIVLIAMMFDRISAGAARESRRAMMEQPPPSRTSGVPRWLSRYVYWSTTLLICLLLTFLADAFPGLQDFPSSLQLSIADPVNGAVAWMRDNLYQIGESGLGTGALSDFIVIWVLNPLRRLLQSLPWISVVAGVALIGWQAGGWRLALLVAFCTYALGGLTMWSQSMDTLSQVLVAVVITVLVGIPLGVAAARWRPFDRILRPLLDFLQTIPPFVYLVPVIILFNPGRVPGLIASVLYALPPITRLTTLGIRQVPVNTTEAARAFGSTDGQLLTKVQLPLAQPSIMMGLNQTVMMVLSMVIIAGLVGGGALGYEAVLGLARNELGTGVQAGLAIVAMAVALDRITQAWALKGQSGRTSFPA